jgi:TPR repeat protein
VLLIEEPGLAEATGEGEQLLRRLAQEDPESRCELGLRLLKGEDLPKNEAEGLEQVLSAAEAGHPRAGHEVQVWLVQQYVAVPNLHFALPPWARPCAARLRALFPSYPIADQS